MSPAQLVLELTETIALKDFRLSQLILQELADIGGTVQALLGGSSRGTFVDMGEEYDVYVRADEQQFVNGGSYNFV